MAIDTWDKLIATVQKDVVKIMNDMDKTWGEDNDNPKYVMMQKVDEEVYRTYNPTWYKTSYELRDSITATGAKVVGDTVEVGLYHDTDKMEYDPDSFKHGSSSGDIREVLPDIIEGEEEWGVNRLFPKNKWNRKTWYQKKTVEDLQNGRFRDWLARKLMEKGYDVE